MSVVLDIPQFNMFIYSPLSVKFGEARGMILEMDDSEGSGQWLCGISSIHIIKTVINYQEIIKTIT